jgi:hypothetical protein
VRLTGEVLAPCCTHVQPAQPMLTLTRAQLLSARLRCVWIGEGDLSVVCRVVCSFW